MSYLLVYAHPNPKSFCHAIKEEIEAAIKQQGGEVAVRDLYQLGFSPALTAKDFEQFIQKQTPADIAKEQEFIRKADVLVFVYPVWWFGMPALLKGYIDRVFSRGFAYDFQGRAIKGLLPDKKVVIFSTTGGPRFAYLLLRFKAAMKTTIDQGIFKFCGMKLALHKYFYAVPAISDAARKKMLAEVRAMRFNAF